MLTVAIRGVLHRKLRLLLTSIAIVLGVGFVSGAFLLTDSMRDSFEKIFSEATQGIDVNVQTQAYTDLMEKAQSSAPGSVAIDLSQVGMSPEDVEKLRAIPGAELVAPSIFEMGAVPLDKDEKPVGSAGAPAFAANWVDEAAEVGALKLVEGDAPKSGEVLLDGTTMERGNFKIGDTVTMQLQGGAKTEDFRISGRVKFGSQDTLNGASISVFDTTQLQSLLDMGDRVSAVSITAAKGVSQTELKRRVVSEFGKDYLVQTGKEFERAQNESIDQSFLQILQNVILGFAAVAVFVGAFTIFNTFTILIGQRTREIGLLRSIGAARRQIIGIVVLEAIVLGIIASTIGILAGFGVAALLRELINAVGAEIPGDGFPLKTRTLVASYSVGVLVTFVASLVPAWRASRLSPLEALRSNSAHAGRGWKTPVFGSIFFLIGAFLVFLGFNADSSATTTQVLSSIGGGFAVGIIGISMLSRLFILPVTRTLSVVLARGTIGDMAKRNVLRNRARSATTASALMIGLALASLVLVFYASLIRTVNDEIDKSVGADVMIYNTSMMTTGTGFVSQELIDKIKETDGARLVAGQYLGGVVIGEKFDPKETVHSITALDEGALGEDGAIKPEFAEGDIEFSNNEALVAQDFAKSQKLELGDNLQLAFTTNKSATFKVAGIVKNSQAIGAPILISLDSFRENQPPQVQSSAIVYAMADSDVEADVLADRIEKQLGSDADKLEVQDTAEIREMFTEQLAPVLGIVLGMLSLSLVIALFGIGNTLALNVFERTREIGLIRAVGGTRPQLRRMIRIESVLVAVFGAVVGVIVGIAAGWALVMALSDQGFVFAISPMGIVGVLVGGFVAGLLASVLPARRAAKTDVLEAIATE